MQALLFIDMLGVRSRWHESGRAGVERAVEKFHHLVREAAGKSGFAEQLEGGMESDSVALICPHTEAAVKIGCIAFTSAFMQPESFDQERLWLRGVIAPSASEEALRSRNVVPAMGTVERHSFSGGMLDAIAVEKSGFKGMRLLIADVLVTAELCAQFRRPRGNLNIVPFKKLRYSQYPTRVAESFQDVLWMDSRNGEGAIDERLRMEQRLRWSARVAEEFVQAAATQVVFHEYSAVEFSVSARGR